MAESKNTPVRPLVSGRRCGSWVRAAAGSVWWLAAPASVFLLIWLPLFFYYHVPRAQITDNDIAAARLFPTDEALIELRDLPILSRYFQNDRQITSSAEGLLSGQLQLSIPPRPPIRVHLPFDARDLDDTPEFYHMPIAGFVIPDILLRAHSATGREEFFQAAREYIVEFAKYDHSAWLPRGLQWNDHAIASRVPVLAEFWRLYRHNAKFQPEEARLVLQLAARSGRMLADPKRFTAATNHGVMQSVGMLHLRLAFPELREFGSYEAVAYERLAEQMRFYINSEGVVLEHSAGYQGLGVEMLGRALRFATLLHRRAPAEWIEKYERAKDVYRRLRRPDGTLAVFGDTDGASDGSMPSSAVCTDACVHTTRIDANGQAAKLTNQPWPPAAAGNALYPLAGYAIWWDGVNRTGAIGGNQTVSMWSYFPGHAHKSADELSVLVWAAGRAWLGNTGYWPYDLRGREESEGWESSNAPHFEGEPWTAQRTSRLISHGDSPSMDFLDMERQTGSQRIRRQLVHLKPSCWIVVDSAVSSEKSALVNIWTPHPSLEVKQEPHGAYVLAPGGAGPSVRGWLISPENFTTSLRRGSLNPFGGWMVLDGIPQPASAMVQRTPSDTWSVAAWSLDESGARVAEAAPRVTAWLGPDEWSMQAPGRCEMTHLDRRRSALTISNDRGEQGTLELAPGPDVSAHRRSIAEAWQAVVRRYPPYREALAFRYRNSWRLLILLILQEAFFLVFRMMGGRWFFGLRALNAAAWLAGGLFVYLRFLS